MHDTPQPLLGVEWWCGSFTIHLDPRAVSADLLLRMATNEQSLDVERRVITVLNGKARDLGCEVLGFRDTLGTPFGWNKRLVIEIRSLQRLRLW